MFFIAIFSIITVYSQTGYKFEKIVPVSGKSKNEIYSLTKMFIAEYWKSAQNVMQNDDKEAGMILVKGTLETKVKTSVFTYSHTVKFYIKDEKYRIIVDNVNCVSNITSMWLTGEKYEGFCVEYCENCEFPGSFKTNMKKNTWIQLLALTKIQLDAIAEDYYKYIINTDPFDDNW